MFCTTENGIDHIARALAAGANEYIMKPFDKDIVAAKFQEVGLIAAEASRCRLNLRFRLPFERPPVTPPDYEYLRKFLKDHSGLDLSADKQYLIESRLLPLARKAGLPASANSCRR